jgi:Ser/Thr protein kinase RdoA (MazF antagonist)
MSDPPSLPEDVAEQILPLYDLAPPVMTWLFSSGLNDLYRVETGAGPLVLKLYRAGWRTPERVREEVAAVLHLHRKGVPVALPIAGRDGACIRTVTRPEGERVAMLLTFAPGEHQDEVDEERCRRLGGLLAHIHQATDDFPTAPVRFDREHLLDRPLRALTPLLHDREEDRDYLLGLARRLTGRLASLPAEGLERGFCHGDFRPANVHWHETVGPTVLDFETSGAGYRAFDLVVVRFFLSGGRPRWEEAEPLWQAYLEGYEERRPLRAAQREAASLLIPLRPIWILGTLLQTARKNWNLEPWEPSRAGPLPGVEFFEGAMRFIRDWDAHYRWEG